MEGVVVSRSAFQGVSPQSCLIAPVFEGESTPTWAVADAALANTLNDLAQRQIFRAKSGETLLLSLPGPDRPAIVALGLGAREKANAEVLRRAAGKLCAVLSKLRATEAVIDAAGLNDVPAEALFEGVALGQYRFNQYKPAAADEPAPVAVERLCFVTAADADAEVLRARLTFVEVACRSANWARDLACLPPNELTPQALADKAREIARGCGLACEVLDEDRMARLGMNALLGVACGSAQRANLITLHYAHPDAKRTIALVGKGITFDTGGISIKPAADMHEMKYDMCGAAAVLGAIQVIAALKPRINVVAVAPAVENMPGGNAQRPGDIVRAYNGKTIEVLNTDAEGRLILADAMAYAADKFKPDAMVDVATLTGAVVIALGHYAAGLLATDDAVAAGIERAADCTGERVWRLPLWDDYAKLTEGTQADLSNIGPARQAGTIMGAAFLKEFAGDAAWAHLDIAGTAYGVRKISYLDSELPTAFGVRLLSRWVLDEAARED